MRLRTVLLSLTTMLTGCASESPVESSPVRPSSLRLGSPRSASSTIAYNYIHYVNGNLGGIRYGFDAADNTLSLELYGTSGSGTVSEVVPDAQLLDVLNFLGAFERAVALEKSAQYLTEPCLTGVGPNCEGYEPMRAAPDGFMGGARSPRRAMRAAVPFGRPISLVGDPYVCGPMYFNILAHRTTTLSISDQVANAAANGAGAVGSIIGLRSTAEQNASDLAYGTEQWSAADCQGPVGTYVSVGNPVTVRPVDFGLEKKEACAGYEIYVPLFTGTGSYSGVKEVHICRWNG